MEVAEGGGAAAAAECGALRSSARGLSRSYGSTARGPAAGQRHLEHRPRPGDTLQGLALRYGVSTEQIMRANRLYANESIFLKECLRIPAPKQEALQNGSRAPDQAAASSAPTFEPLSAELSPSDFLKRLDSKITQSKAAAIRKLSDGADRLDGAVVGSASTSVGSSRRLEQTLASRTVSAQWARLGPVRLTKTTRVTTLRETEDEIFDL
ncbi:lysM and putative peptidoglycan-binding domain-containing protein 1 isoform X2 [Chiloscyllium plagiosum]|uniref:lysM and putative peptidoglycan-binding domain-containing protein 1 isoform X2 n=1 Tax=Chiloscyllium plagiosum TaxID=36176 RepID=UPI001CB7D4DA|nr:lysM and putative peptidoglycan-binding domain-containing protein 1 isoform X2 [Chiloscyllium plagiosum]